MFIRLFVYVCISLLHKRVSPIDYLPLILLTDSQFKNKLKPNLIYMRLPIIHAFITVITFKMDAVGIG